MARAVLPTAPSPSIVNLHWSVLSAWSKSSGILVRQSDSEARCRQDEELKEKKKEWRNTTKGSL